MLRILYLVHDLSDPAVARRVAMLDAGGGAVTLAGFCREDRTAGDMPLARPPVDLGTTRDGRFAQRMGAVALAAARLPTRLGQIPVPDVIMARNLEMLALARRFVAATGLCVPIVYECLDIHRLLLGDGALGGAMRAAERRLARDAALLVTSSPAFTREYFESRKQVAAPIDHVENKVLDLGGLAEAHPAPAPLPGEPWRIGWFGALRCRRSFDILAAFARAMEGRFEIVLRGRPALDQIPDFHERIAAAPHMRFAGPYLNPDDLAAIYGEVHFTWAIDFFEAGMNSEWLLPNRLYEGGRHGAVAIARRGTETARFLEQRGIGVVLGDCSAGGMAAALGELDFAAARQAMRTVDPGTWTHDRGDCQALVERLHALTRNDRETAQWKTAA
jgi:succinoglycan biosynthesis protein ExoL